MEINRSNLFLVYFLIILTVNNTLSKVYDKCDLAQELIQKDKVLFHDINTWLCIIEGESSFDTRAHHLNNWDGSDDHGLFQINDRYWCDPQDGKPTANVCSLSCDKLRDDDITDDISCAKLIFNIHGFNAWAVHQNCINQPIIKFHSIFDNQCKKNDLNFGKNKVRNKEIRSRNWIQPINSILNSFNFNKDLNLLSNNNDNNLNAIFIAKPNIDLLVDNGLGYIIETLNPAQEDLIYLYVLALNKRK